MVDIQTVSIMLASASVMAGIVYYAFQIRHQTGIRKTDLAIRLFSMANSKEFNDASFDILNMQVKDYEDYTRKYGPIYSQGRREIGSSINLVLGVYEMVGVLLYKKQIDLDMAYRVFSAHAIRVIHERTKPIIAGIRRDANDPSLDVGFDYLYNEIMRNESKLRKALPVCDYSASD